MPFWAYILRNESTGRHYCGQTNRLSHRIKEHNDPNYQGSKTTKRFKGPGDSYGQRNVSAVVKQQKQSDLIVRFDPQPNQDIGNTPGSGLI